MIAYATKIDSDIELPFSLPTDAAIYYKINLSMHLPHKIKTSLRCGMKLYSSHGREVYLYSDGDLFRNEKTQFWCYEVENIVKFYWSSGSSKIYYELEEKQNKELFGFWFLHLFLPLYLSFEGMYDFFHAGAVEIGGKPIFFIAPSMGGKSTMTDYFLQRGHMLISDDKVATYQKDKQFIAVPSIPYHRPYRGFEELGYYTNHFSRKNKPIHAIYELKRAEEDAEVSIKEIKGYQKFDILLPNYLYVFSWIKEERFKYISQMLQSVSVFRVTVPWDMNRLDEVYDAINIHTNNIK